MLEAPYWLGLFLIAICLGGLGLGINCLHSLLKGDDVYDSDSRRTMAVSQLLGIVAGMGIAVASASALLKLIGF